jgi:hypothetical protein
MSSSKESARLDFTQVMQNFERGFPFKAAQALGFFEEVGI